VTLLSQMRDIYIYIYIYILYIFSIGKTSNSRVPKSNNDYFLLGIKLVSNIKACNLTVQCIRIMRLATHNIGFWIRKQIHTSYAVYNTAYTTRQISRAFSTKIMNLLLFSTSRSLHATSRKPLIGF
jgi:hypothetical protein